MFFSKFKKSSLERISRKRQWGTEQLTDPLSSIREKPSAGAIAFSRVAILLTAFFWVAYVLSVIIRQLIDGPKSYNFTLEAFGYLVIVTFLTFSALVYLIARQGALLSFNKHTRTPRALLNKHFSKNKPGITVLIPSYDEETEVVRKTMMSAALQEYPNIRIVLLIDDDPSKVTPANMARLEATRALGKEIEALLKKPFDRFYKALLKFKKISNKKITVPETEILTLASHYAWAAKWLENLAEKNKKGDHVDIFYKEQVLESLAKDLSFVKKALMSSYKEKACLPKEQISQLYNRLLWVFGAKLEIFERKRYISLSRELNKAMNLNSYIGLMGGLIKKKRLRKEPF